MDKVICPSCNEITPFDMKDADPQKCDVCKRMIAICPTCYGSGSDGGVDDVFECGNCNGKGLVEALGLELVISS